MYNDDHNFMSDAEIEFLEGEQQQWEADFDEQYGDITNDHDEHEEFTRKLDEDPEYIEWIESLEKYHENI
jgi:hypothetical protein